MTGNTLETKHLEDSFTFLPSVPFLSSRLLLDGVQAFKPNICPAASLLSNRMVKICQFLKNFIVQLFSTQNYIKGEVEFSFSNDRSGFLSLMAVTGNSLLLNGLWPI